jgi:hypothetical protein
VPRALKTIWLDQITRFIQKRTKARAWCFNADMISFTMSVFLHSAIPS